jgi:hypothetical protein
MKIRIMKTGKIVSYTQNAGFKNPSCEKFGKSIINMYVKSPLQELSFPNICIPAW